jgi:hypothetical protein
MKAAKWAEIRRLHELEKLSGRAIAKKLGCSREFVKKALALDEPPGKSIRTMGSKIDPFKSQIAAILARYPELSAMRVLEKISQSRDGQSGYTGKADNPIACALVSSNDAPHMARFLRNLKNHGFSPKTFITDRSPLYPVTLAEIWPEAKHQLCVFHVMSEVKPNAYFVDVT